MKRILVLSFVLLIAADTALDAQWAKAYGGKDDDWANDIIAAPGGGFIVVGATKSFKKKPSWVHSYWIFKLKNDGTVLWQKRDPAQGFAVGQQSEAMGVLKTKDAKIAVLTVRQQLPALSLPRIIKMDSAGSEHFDFFHAEHANFVNAPSMFSQINDGGYVIVGDCDDHLPRGSVPRNAIIYKYNKLYDLRSWCAPGGDQDDGFQAVAPTADGGFLVAGTTKSFGAGSTDIWLLKLTSGCEIVRQVTLGGAGQEAAFDIEPTPDGGCLILGQTDSAGAGGWDIWILKLNEDGQSAWQKTYGGAKGDYAHALCPAGDGGYIVAGTTYSFGAGNADAWVFKIDAKGRITWQMRYGGKDYDGAWAVREIPGAAAGFLIAGRTRSFGAGGDDALVMKLSQDGMIDPSCGGFVGPTKALVKATRIQARPTQVEAPGSNHAMLDFFSKAESFAKWAQTVICKK